ncbi:MAG: hypothetical protein C4306_11880 [Thermoleophilia bacterium]
MSPAELAILEALTDPRLGELSEAELASELAAHGLIGHDPGLLSRDEAAGRESGHELARHLDEARRSRRIEWAARTLTFGELLDTFARFCEEELEETTVIERAPVRLDLSWRRERARVELRAGLLFCERLAGGDPLLLLGDLTEAAVGRFLDDAALRSRVAVYDLVRLEKVNTVRCSIFVHFEWFLRDTYGVKILPAADFTQGLIDRGVISLGFG